MSSRFTETEKWQKQNFRKLSPEAKLLFFYIVDNCDIAGFWNIDLDLASYFTGLELVDKNSFENMRPTRGIEGAFEELASRFIVNENVLWVRNFSYYQNNLPLTLSNNAHKGILKRIKNHKSFGELVLKELEKQTKQRGLQGATKPLLSPPSKGKGKGKKGGMGENKCIIDKKRAFGREITYYHNGKCCTAQLCADCRNIFNDLVKSHKIKTANTSITEIENKILKERARR